jgi:hypothetical protein
MSLKAELNLKSAILSTSLLQPIDSKSKGRYLEVICRQIPGQEKPWLSILLKMLTKAADSDFSLHVCRRYVVKDRKLAFGWNLSIDAKSTKKLDEAVDILCKILAEAKPVLTLDEVRNEPTPQNNRHISPPKFNQGRPGPKLGNKRLPLPRASGMASQVQEAPSGFQPEIKLVSEKVDDKGRSTQVFEMPLPHTYHELNKPNAKGRGARMIMES